MRHVGNDIVDLSHPLAKAKSLDTRFRKRVFLPEEEIILQRDIQSDAMLWALWTGKEAGYKASQKIRGDIPAIPKLYRVQFDGTAEGVPDSRHPGARLLLGTVTTPLGNMSLETLLTPDYVHSLAATFSTLAGQAIVWKVERMPFAENLSPADESFFIRAAAKRRLCRYLPGSRPGDFEIRRAKGHRGLGPPCVYFHKQASSIDISLSHDGAFAAYAFTSPS